MAALSRLGGIFDVETRNLCTKIKNLFPVTHRIRDKQESGQLNLLFQSSKFLCTNSFIMLAGLQIQIEFLWFRCHLKAMFIQCWQCQGLSKFRVPSDRALRSNELL